MAFPDSFVTARLSAERLMPHHFADLLRMHSDPEQMAMLGGIRDAAQTQAYLDRNLQHWADYGFGSWILRETERNRIAGRAILRHLLLEETDEVEVGYSFFPEFWGRGLATEIARACLGFGFETLGLRSIVALTLPQNLPSRRVLEKAGLSYEREVIHDSIPHVLFRVRRPANPEVPGEGGDAIRIEEFRPEQAEAFARLNRSWLVEYGLLEPSDEPQLADPVGEILEPGGRIFVACLGGEVVGTAAVLPHGADAMELVKLGVAPEVQGRGVGRRLVDACIAHARETGARRLLLISNSRLAAAVRLYEKLGFEHRPVPQDVPYVTANVCMELDLPASPKG
jgi:RimJ/RimL family protein N-acetyltransferase